jgi:DNA-binding transcriptional LysR family regulator
MLNPDHLQTFLAVADGGSFTNAAAQLGFTQPAVSQQIRALEAQLGDARLFRRVGKRMHLTHAGEELLSHARELVALAERAERHLLGLQGYVKGRAVVGCAASTGERLLPALLAAFHARHAGVHFAVEVGPADRLLGGIAESRFHAVVVDDHPRRRSLEVLPLGRESVVCVAARGHVLLERASVEPSELVTVPLILPQRGSGLRRNLEDLIRRRMGTTDPVIVLETDSTALAAQAVADGLGVAFVPQSRVPRSRDLGMVPLPDLELEQHWFLVRSRGGDEGTAIDGLWNFTASPEGQRLVQRLGLKPPRPGEEHR